MNLTGFYKKRNSPSVEKKNKGWIEYIICLKGMYHTGTTFIIKHLNIYGLSVCVLLEGAAAT